MDEIEQALTGQDITGTEVAVAIGLVALGIIAYFLVGWLLRRSKERASKLIPVELMDVAVRVIQFLVLWVFIVWALNVLGASTGALTLLVVVVLLTGAFLAKPFFDGLVSSVVVASRSAVSVGEEVGIDDIEGEIERIARRSTVVRTSDGRRVHIANSELIDKTVTVFTAYDERRSSINVTVALETDLDDTDRVIRDALVGVDAIRRIGSIRARSFSDGVDLSIRIWHGPHLAEGNEAVDAAVRALRRAFEEAGIGFAPSTFVRIDREATTSEQREP
jgi:small-conductance mechanosensitive channel